MTMERSPRSQEEDRIHFLKALAFVKVPARLCSPGVEVMMVAANGKTAPAVMRISEDKFTASFISTTKSSASGGGFLFLTRSAPVADVLAVDVGEMDRIQRGQSTQQFEMAKKKVDRLERGKSQPSLASDAAHSSRHSRNGSYGGGGGDHSTGSTSGSPMVQLDPKLSFSIIFRGAHTLDLMAHSLAEREEICDTLDRILEAYLLAKTRVADDVRLLRYVWLDVVVGPLLDRGPQQQQPLKEKKSFINVHQIERLFTQINFTMKPRDLNANYEKFGKVIGLDRGQRRRGLSFDQLADFMHYVRRNQWMVKPVTVIWNELFGELMKNGKKRETVSDRTFLVKFLHGKQGQGRATLVDVRKIFRKLHDMEVSHASHSEAVTDPNRITKDQFEAYLLGRHNDAFDPDKETHDRQDMNQPLSEYFINSSHNTYLIGDQYTSQSSVEMYSEALYRGCRCLELDIWDGPSGPGTPTHGGGGTPSPVVWHGRTMTTKIRFVDIIRCIKVFLNFHPTEYPLILSFENHCSIPYQEVMAEQLVRILGDSLYIPKEASLNGNLPSPDQLCGMVVIKGRRPPTSGKTVSTEVDLDDTDDESDDEGGARSAAVSAPSSSPGDLTGAVEVALQEATRVMAKKQKISPALARLTLFHGSKYKNWETSMQSPTYHMHSFSENKVRSQCRNRQARNWTIYNHTHMTRTYPAGSRVDSSNYNPLLAWSTGCQMVALNFQTQDHFLRLNDGRFRENGNCGYVLKPVALMVRDNLSTPTAPTKLTVRVLSGSCLPKAKGSRTGDCIDPYVKLSVFDVKNEEKETVTEFSTGVVKMNGFFPIWTQEKHVFSVEHWAVAMLQLTVYDMGKDEFIASSSIPISCLRRGIRSVKLNDATNTRSGAFDFASLLVDIKMGTVMAEI